MTIETTETLDLDAIEAAARAPMTFDRPKINCTHDVERGHAPWCFACGVADRASRPTPFEQRGRTDVTALVAEVRRLREALATAALRSARAMRDAAAMVCRYRAEELDASVTEAQAADDEEGAACFAEALSLEEKIRALPLPATGAALRAVEGGR